jgi:hypothetical protein
VAIGRAPARPARTPSAPRPPRTGLTSLRSQARAAARRPSPSPAQPPANDKAEKEALKEEVLNMARMIRTIGGFKLLMLDTENKFVSTGMAKEIALAAGGRYHYIPKATDASMAAVASQALAGLM